MTRRRETANPDITNNDDEIKKISAFFDILLLACRMRVISWKPPKKSGVSQGIRLFEKTYELCRCAHEVAGIVSRLAASYPPVSLSCQLRTAHWIAKDLVHDDGRKAAAAESPHTLVA